MRGFTDMSDKTNVFDMLQQIMEEVKFGNVDVQFKVHDKRVVALVKEQSVKRMYKDNVQAVGELLQLIKEDTAHSRTGDLFVHAYMENGAIKSVEFRSQYKKLVE
jgi:hypothetical protein